MMLNKGLDTNWRAFGPVGKKAFLYSCQLILCLVFVEVGIEN